MSCEMSAALCGPKNRLISITKVFALSMFRENILQKAEL